jgi:carbon storage regulator
MLVLSRKRSEIIRVGDDIKIVVVQIDKHRVKIGIQAPSGVEVHRSEVYERIQQADAPVEVVEPISKPHAPRDIEPKGNATRAGTRLDPRQNGNGRGRMFAAVKR